ncbi:Tol-Pal system beta propeller repeat protein TolB [Sphingobium sufflavum]|uniref:Tol-Pal system beta propeller repeat protein TolB n=1 Tax=Sphingobium sufflavum TaxID=1129547 RepID=UPI001F3328CD|nr:Tol-Pal system beta propeller repeat protein TolB [Sphingobium sufflavum]MCE7796623.1 Tol-Pal system beta propeller repeat protein TolB [Sphingobium sufflavum]
MTRLLLSVASFALTFAIATASAQQPAPTAPPASASAPQAEQGLSGSVTDETNEAVRIAIPPMPTQQDVNTPAGSTASLGVRIAEVIASDLKNSGLFQPTGPNGVGAITIPEVTAPAYDRWSGMGAEALVQGFIRSAGGDADITVGCYLYDVSLKTEQTRLGYVVPSRDWRRAAHKCADAIYARLTGESPFFDSRIAYIAETGPKDNRVKRLAIMDSDGANHRFITNGQSIALTPRFSPDYKSIVYVSYVGRRVRIYAYDIGAGTQKLVTESENAVFAPRWSPDGRTILFSMASGGTTNIYKVSAAGGGTPVRLTNTPGINVGGSFSPDGSKIVFESDRSGKQQIYVMNVDGSGQQRISFGGGSYATPEWSPRGDLIAFTKLGSFNVGVMTPSGQSERILTHGWQDEAPSWSPNGRVLQFFRTSQGRSGKSEIWQVDLTGVNERRIPTPVDGSDPAWGPLLP